MKQEVPAQIDSDLVLVDASVKSRMKEDEIYLEDQELQERLRRGNTLLEFVDKNGKLDYLIARRGMMKSAFLIV